MHSRIPEKIKCNLCDFSALNEEIMKKHMKIAMGHKKDEMCKFYQRGNCRRGRFCLYKHEKTANSQSKSWSGTHLPRSNNPTSARQCKYFENCVKFPNCGFAHREVCKFQDHCYNQQNCRFVHISPSYFLGGPPFNQEPWMMF